MRKHASKLQPGDHVVKNPARWTPSDFDLWECGEGIGMVLPDQPDADIGLVARKPDSRARVNSHPAKSMLRGPEGRWRATLSWGKSDVYAGSVAAFARSSYDQSCRPCLARPGLRLRSFLNPSPPPSMEITLIVVGGRTKRTHVTLRVPATIGRSRRADLTIAHPMISRQHCQIFEADGLLRIRDLGSLNGTIVGGNAVAEAPLRPNDEFTVGPITFRVQYEYGGEETAEAPEMPLPLPTPTQPVGGPPECGPGSTVNVAPSDGRLPDFTQWAKRARELEAHAVAPLAPEAGLVQPDAAQQETAGRQDPASESPAPADAGSKATAPAAPDPRSTSSSDPELEDFFNAIQ